MRCFSASPRPEFDARNSAYREEPSRYRTNKHHEFLSDDAAIDAGDSGADVLADDIIRAEMSSAAA